MLQPLGFLLLWHTTRLYFQPFVLLWVVFCLTPRQCKVLAVYDAFHTFFFYSSAKNGFGCPMLIKAESQERKSPHLWISALMTAVQQSGGLLRISYGQETNFSFDILWYYFWTSIISVTREVIFRSRYNFLKYFIS